MPGRPLLRHPSPRGARRRTPRAAVPALAAAAALLLPACSGPVTVEAAEDGGSDACAALVQRLPATVADAPRRDTSGGPGTAAWGDPAILLRCGVEPLGATTRPCVGVPGPDGEDVDWVVLAGDGSGAIVQTFGREPAVEVEVPASYGPAPVTVLPDLGEAVAAVEPRAVCVD